MGHFMGCLAMNFLRLTVVVVYVALNLCLHKARICSQKCKLRSIEHLFLLFDLLLEVAKALSVEVDEAPVLSCKTFRLFS